MPSIEFVALVFLVVFLATGFGKERDRLLSRIEALEEKLRNMEAGK